MNVVVDFWEDHCVECGEPACFASCTKFQRGAHGRCRRVEFFGGGRVRFREWGKLELLWHGRMGSPETAARIKAWNVKCETVAIFLQKVIGWLPLPYGRGPYGIFRSLRWRYAMHQAEYGGRPTNWLFEASAKMPIALVLEIMSAMGNVIFADRIELGLEPKKVYIELPRVESGAIFSIRPANPSMEAEILISANELIADDAYTVKCVAWDLDGVLWKGTLSEGDDVVLNKGIMDVIKALDARGIVSSICSKNDEAEALAKLKALGVEEWFVFPQINWGSKSESLKRLANEMNIGLDSIAFVDDREENRNEVSEQLPDVRVFSEDDIQSIIQSLPSEGETKRIGSLGGARRRMYRDEMKRRKAYVAFSGDTEEFAAASGLDFELLPVVEGERLERCLELLQRTNQLNLTAHRYDRDHLVRLVAESECRAVHVWDRYGDYGIVGFVAWKETRLLECCFSCRVARRGVERKVLDMIAAGRCFEADVVETSRNAPMREIVAEWIGTDVKV